ncbi:MAG: hypothetical protein AAGC77_10150, partial [Pseudomonadota bacterium]
VPEVAARLQAFLAAGYHALDVLGGLKEAPVIRFQNADVVRHPLVAKIVDAYAAHDKRTPSS